MVQKIYPWCVIWVPSSRLMWADQLKKMTAVPSIYQEVHEVGYRIEIGYTINHPTTLHTMISSDPLLPADGTFCCGMYPTGKVAIS